jgi:hypothetical protein
MNDESVVKWCNECDGFSLFTDGACVECGSELDTGAIFNSEKVYYDHPVDELTAKMLKTLDDALMIGMDRDSDEA